MVVWRKEEEENINASLGGAERKAALCALLEQEMQFIASIERHRLAAGERNQEKAVQAFLNKVLTFYSVLRASVQHTHCTFLTLNFHTVVLA